MFEEGNLLWNLFSIKFWPGVCPIFQNLSAPYILGSVPWLLPSPFPQVSSFEYEKLYSVLNVFFGKTFKAIFRNTTISYLINNRCLIKCKLALYPQPYLLNLLLTVFTNFVSFDCKAFCKLLINIKLKWRHFLSVEAPALAALNSPLLQGCSVFPAPPPPPQAEGSHHLEIGPQDSWLRAMWPGASVPQAWNRSLPGPELKNSEDLVQVGNVRSLKRTNTTSLLPRRKMSSLW